MTLTHWFVHNGKVVNRDEIEVENILETDIEYARSLYDEALKGDLTGRNWGEERFDLYLGFGPYVEELLNQNPGFADLISVPRRFFTVLFAENRLQAVNLLLPSEAEQHEVVRPLAVIVAASKGFEYVSTALTQSQAEALVTESSSMRPTIITTVLDEDCRPTEAALSLRQRSFLRAIVPGFGLVMDHHS